jgi:hypothetical protein
MMNQFLKWRRIGRRSKMMRRVISATALRVTQLKIQTIDLVVSYHLSAGNAVVTDN